MNPMVKALHRAREQFRGEGGGMGEGNPEMSNPLGKNKETGDLFLDRSLFKEVQVKPGDVISVSGTVTAIGDKIGFQPSSIEAEGGEEVEEEMSDEGNDNLEVKNPAV